MYLSVEEFMKLGEEERLGLIFPPNDELFFGHFFNGNKVTIANMQRLYEYIIKDSGIKGICGIIIFGSSVRKRDYIFQWIKPKDIDILVICDTDKEAVMPPVFDPNYPDSKTEEGMHVIFKKINMLHEKDKREKELFMEPIFHTAIKEGVVIVANERILKEAQKISRRSAREASLKMSKDDYVLRIEID